MVLINVSPKISFKSRISKRIENYEINRILNMMACGQNGNGANFRLFGGAVKALCSRQTKSLKLSFPAPFFGSFFGRAKNELRIKY
jgi:hypothetical protein